MLFIFLPASPSSKNDMFLYVKCFLCLCLISIIPLAGCAPVEIRGDYFQKGFDYSNLGYTTLPESAPLNETMVIKNLRIVIVGRADVHPSRTISGDPDAVGTVVEPVHEIRVIGKKLKGKIILNQVVLGNELKHLMNALNPEVACPCEIEAFEACVAIHPPDQCGKKGPQHQRHE